MIISKIQRILLISLAAISGLLGSLPAQTPFPFVLAQASRARAEKNLILVLDVKQEEYFAGPCISALATALSDKIAPIIASVHAFSDIKSKINAADWHLYQNKNLMLFIPKKYLCNNGLSIAGSTGFNLTGWKEVKINQTPLYGTSDVLSQQSVEIIANTLKTGKKDDTWKIYMIGHGHPDASQICGLNLADFRRLLATFNDDISTDFLIYQTCFGGGKHQLKNAYIKNQGMFKTFNFPIICSCVTNCVSFGNIDDYRLKGLFKVPSFVGIFTKLNNSSIISKKASQILHSVNEFTHSLDYAEQLHWANNLLLIRMPGNQYFEPVIDNETVFRASALPMASESLQKICSDNRKFKCIVIDKLVINLLDARRFQNFIICSGIPGSKHYIKELWVSDLMNTKDPKELLQDIAHLFYSLGFLSKKKTFYIEKLRIGDLYTANNISLEQGKCSLLEDPVITIKAQCNGKWYNGQVLFEAGINIPIIQSNTVSQQNNKGAQMYNTAFAAAIKKLIEKFKNPFMLFGSNDQAELFSVV